MVTRKDGPVYGLVELDDESMNLLGRFQDELAKRKGRRIFVVPYEVKVDHSPSQDDVEYGDELGGPGWIVGAGGTVVPPHER